MPRLRCRLAAPVLAVLLALAAAGAAPLAAAAPARAAHHLPAVDSWWAALVAVFDGLLGGPDGEGARRVSAPEGSALEPDGFTTTRPCLPGQMVGCSGGGSRLLVEPAAGIDGGALIDPND